MPLIPLLFLVSGVPALLYQIVWQRILFGIFGTNIESVTIVVAAFMLGLGLGSLAGGAVSRRVAGRWLVAFAVVELVMGALGLASPAVFGFVDEAVGSASLPMTATAAFLAVLVPTLLMGATLPLLTADLVARTRAVGRSVALLYGLNTLGSALACVAAAEGLMGGFGMGGVIALAAGINILVGLGAVGLYVRLGRSEAVEAPPASSSPTGSLAPAMLVTGLVGFVTLSHEILWVRAVSFMTMGSAKAFPWVLALFLAGIAVGALAARPLERRVTGRGLLSALVATVAVAWVSIPAMAWMVTTVEPRWTLLWVFLGASLWGLVLPLFSQAFVAADEAAGEGLSKLYAANIAGAVAGTLATGFVGLDVLGLETVAGLVAALGLVAAWVAARVLGAGKGGLIPLAGVGALVVLGGPTLFDGLWERLYFKEWYKGQRFEMRSETRSGVVGVMANGLVVGGGAYDGTTNLRPAAFDLVRENHIHRAYAASFLHPNPKRVLVVGLSMGAWSQVLVHHPQVEEVVIVEINPGYLDLIPQVPEVAGLLDNPKVRMVVDDGRRWLRNHRQERFDLIVMNTTFNWRMMASNLLSTDFLGMVRPHLKEGGVLFYNSTFSLEARRTALESYPHVLHLANFLAVSDTPFDLDYERWKRTLLAYRIEGEAMVDEDVLEEAWMLDRLLDWYRSLDRTDLPWSATIETRARLEETTRDARIITDDNMGTEWTGGPGLGSFFRTIEAR